MGRSGIRSAYATGRGKIVVRARAEIVEEKNGRFKIIVTELPYQVNKTMRRVSHGSERYGDGWNSGVQ